MPVTRDNAVDDALARSVVYYFLSVALQPPTTETLQPPSPSFGEPRRSSKSGGGGSRPFKHDGFAAVIAALRQLDRQAGGPLQAVAARLAAMSPATVEAMAEGFVRLFGHTARGLVCACETEYGADNTFHQPQQLADIAGYYLAFGLRPVVSSHNRVDHIACECEFMDFLNRKAAVLLAADGMGSEREERSGAEGSPRATSLAGCRGPRHARDESLEVTARAARAFLRDHLARFGRAFASRLASEDPGGYFGVLGHVLLAFLNAECTRLGIDAGPADLVLRPEIADDAPMVCGSAGSMACGSVGELIQIQRQP